MRAHRRNTRAARADTSTSAAPRCGVVWLLLLMVGAPPAAAQQEVPFAQLALLGGQLHYKLADSRNDGMLALRLAAPLVPLGMEHWLVEPNVSYGRFEGSTGQRQHVFVAEVQVQLQSGISPVRPYLGVGGGMALNRVDSTLHVRPTVSADVGVRADLAESFGVLGELRLRRLGLFQGWTREITVGVYGAWR